MLQIDLYCVLGNDLLESLACYQSTRVKNRRTSLVGVSRCRYFRAFHLTKYVHRNQIPPRKANAATRSVGGGVDARWGRGRGRDSAQRFAPCLKTALFWFGFLFREVYLSSLSLVCFLSFLLSRGVHRIFEPGSSSSSRGPGTQPSVRRLSIYLSAVYLSIYLPTRTDIHCLRVLI